MRSEDFDRIRRDVPKFAARFRIVKLVPWVESLGYKLGDTVLYHPNGCFMSERGLSTISPYASHVEFVGYVRIRDEGDRWVAI